MIRVKLMSIMVNDQDRARRFYTGMLGFHIKHDVPIGDAAWLTLVAPDDAVAAIAVLVHLGDPRGFLVGLFDQPEVDRATAGYVFLGAHGREYLTG